MRNNSYDQSFSDLILKRNSIRNNYDETAKVAKSKISAVKNGALGKAVLSQMLRTELEIEDIKQIGGLKLIRSKLFPDTRGYFAETYNEHELGALGFCEKFKQDNHSYSKFGVLRGLHAQPGMGKLVSVISGAIYDVAVDIRPTSETFGKWYGVVLDEETQTSFWIPDGFLHGFHVLSEKGAHITYKCTATYNAQVEFGVNPFDPELAIDWRITDPCKLIMSDRDRSHQNLKYLSLRKGECL